MYHVKDVMTDCVVVIAPEATIDEAVSILLDHRVSGLPVVDELGRLLGVISEYDIIDLVYKADIEHSRVRDHMTTGVRTLNPDSSLDDAASILCEHRIRRIPVVEEGRLVGILSRRDLIRFVRDIRKQDEMDPSCGSVAYATGGQLYSAGELVPDQLRQLSKI